MPRLKRSVLVKLAAEDSSGKDQGKIGLLTKSMYGTRDAASNWERDWQGHLEHWSHVLGRRARSLFHGDDFTVAGSKESLLELRKQLEERVSNQSEHHRAGSAKSIKALSRRICWGETGILYQHDPRHVDFLIDSLGLENRNTVQTRKVDDVNDENPAQLDPEQIGWNGSHVARCLFFSQDRADMTFAVNQLCQKMSDPTQLNSNDSFGT